MQKPRRPVTIVAVVLLLLTLLATAAVFNSNVVRTQDPAHELLNDRIARVADDTENIQSDLKELQIDRRLVKLEQALDAVLKLLWAVLGLTVTGAGSIIGKLIYDRHSLLKIRASLHGVRNAMMVYERSHQDEQRKLLDEVDQRVNRIESRLNGVCQGCTVAQYMEVARQLRDEAASGPNGAQFQEGV